MEKDEAFTEEMLEELIEYVYNDGFELENKRAKRQ